ncbi:MAG: hypothetical protein Q9219_006209 [cf. Caloplaca sp. 3 TL-2023]
MLLEEGSSPPSEGPGLSVTDHEMSTDIVDDQTTDVFTGFESGGEEDKDSTELELERAVFGDEPGFYERLKAHGSRRDNRDNLTPAKSVAHDAIADDVRDIDDADLFILDSGPVRTSSPERNRQHLEASLDDSSEAWHDSDDERITVSLQGNPRLRKLRIREDEDLLDGKEYSRRLRRQYERLYSVPDWVIQARKKKECVGNRNRSRDASQRSSRDSSSDEEMLFDSGETSAAPLAKFLQQTSSLLRPDHDGGRGKTKLRPEVIDIQRTKDVGGAQPVRISSQHKACWPGPAD